MKLFFQGGGKVGESKKNASKIATETVKKNFKTFSKKIHNVKDHLADVVHGQVGRPERGTLGDEVAVVDGGVLGGRGVVVPLRKDAIIHYAIQRHSFECTKKSLPDVFLAVGENDGRGALDGLGIDIQQKHPLRPDIVRGVQFFSGKEDQIVPGMSSFF